MAEFVLTPQIKALALRSMRDLRGEVVFIVNAETSKPIRVAQNGNVTGNGGLGANARFKVLRGDRPHQLGPVVRFKNVATGHFLAIKGGQLTVGGGGEHCEFIVEMANMAVFLKKHNNPRARIGFNANGSPVPANKLGDGARGRFFIFDVDHVVKVPVAQGPTPAQIAAQQRAQQAAQQQALIAQQQAQLAAQQQALAAQHAQQQAMLAQQQAAQAQALAQQQAAMAHNVPRAVAHQHPHHPGPHHHHPGPHRGAPAPAHPRPGQRFALKVSDGNLFVHAAGGPREGHSLVLKQNAMGAPASHFILHKTVFPNTYVISSAHADLCLHAWGGSKEGMPIKLHGNQGYARQHANSKFQIHMTGGARFVLKVHDADLCYHAKGGSRDGMPIVLHNGKAYNSSHGNGQFQFIPV